MEYIHGNSILSFKQGKESVMVPCEDFSHPFEILALVNIHDVYGERAE